MEKREKIESIKNMNRMQEKRENPSTIYSAENLTIGYQDGKKQFIVHKNLSLDIPSGQLISLLGPNGAGKSTLLRTLSGAQMPLGGMLTIGGKDLHTISAKKRSMIISVVLTDRTQIGGLTLYELVALGRQPHTGFFGRLSKKDDAIIEQALQDVGMTALKNRYVAQLSDGERQKGMIAKALVQESPLILLDEPTAFLDIVSRIEIISLLHQLAHKKNRTILLSTHDIEQALILSDQLWLLRPDKGLVCGTTEDILLNGDMDTLFDNKKILFDTNHGTYYPRITHEKEISLRCENNILAHWTINALNRCGYRVNVNNEFLPMIIAEDKHHFKLKTAQQEWQLTSFEELVKSIFILH